MPFLVLIKVTASPALIMEVDSVDVLAPGSMISVKERLDRMIV